MKKPALLFLFALATIALFGAHASRAETFHTCKGFITSVPAVITQQGVWCMDKDLATAISVGAAISIGTNNVTIDCNGFKLGGLAAGAGTQTRGIQAFSRLNVAVRNCAIRGFAVGLEIDGGAGHLVEDNRFDGNTMTGIAVGSDPGVTGSIVRRNVVLDTGGSTLNNEGRAMQFNAPVDVIDNLVDGVQGGAVSADGSVSGMTFSYGAGTRVSGNRVRGLAPVGAGSAFGVFVFTDSPLLFRDNVIEGPGTGTAMLCIGSQQSVQDNLFAGFEFAFNGCTDDGGNILRLAGPP